MSSPVTPSAASGWSPVHPSCRRASSALAPPPSPPRHASATPPPSPIASLAFAPLTSPAPSTSVPQPSPDACSWVLDCNDERAKFIHASADNVTMSDILAPLYILPVVQSFFPLTGVLGCDGHSMPLLVVQVTELANGGCSLNHVGGAGARGQRRRSWSKKVAELEPKQEGGRAGGRWEAEQDAVRAGGRRW